MLGTRTWYFDPLFAMKILHTTTTTVLDMILLSCWALKWWPTMSTFTLAYCHGYYLTTLNSPDPCLTPIRDGEANICDMISRVSKIFNSLHCDIDANVLIQPAQPSCTWPHVFMLRPVYWSQSRPYPHSLSTFRKLFYHLYECTPAPGSCQLIGVNKLLFQWGDTEWRGC